MSKLPISVIVPFNHRDSWLFENYCLPAIEQNNPEEIIVINNDRTRGAKINEGFEKSKCEYIFIADSNSCPCANLLSRMMDILTKIEGNPNHLNFSFVYSDFWAIKTNCHAEFSIKDGAKKFFTQEFDWEFYTNFYEDLRGWPREDAYRHWIKNGKLEGRKGSAASHASFFVKNIYFSRMALEENSYLESQALIKRDKFKPYDEDLKCLEDWDFWLNVTSDGTFGMYITDIYPLCIRFFNNIEHSIKDDSCWGQEESLIRERHGISCL